MIKNTEQNRSQYLKRADDLVILCYKNGETGVHPISPESVQWGHPNIVGFILVNSNKKLEVTEEEDRAWVEMAMNKARVDNVNHPEHYQSEDGIECIDAIKAALTDEEFKGYCKGNALKYVWRERMKGGTESLQKANWYLNRLIGETK